MTMLLQTQADNDQTTQCPKCGKLRAAGSGSCPDAWCSGWCTHETRWMKVFADMVAQAMRAEREVSR